MLSMLLTENIPETNFTFVAKYLWKATRVLLTQIWGYFILDSLWLFCSFVFPSYVPDSLGGCFFSPGAVGHHGDNLAEKILSVLPKLPGHKTDVMVNMVELTTLQTTDETCSIIAPGCLAQPK